MKDSDALAVTRVLEEWMKKCPEAAAAIKTVKIKSPHGNSETDAVRVAFGDRITFKFSDITTWNLNDGPMKMFIGEIDMVVSCNIFMASPDPLKWLIHCGKTAPYLVLQDMVRAWRAGNDECGVDTGDITRYTFTSHGELARPEANSIYDMSQHDEFIDHIEFYSDDGYAGKDCRKFVAVIRVGDLVKSLEKPKKPRKKGDADD